MAQTAKQKRVVKRWIEALRSGDYAQGKNHLCQLGNEYDRFCCLGVLCDMAVREGVVGGGEAHGRVMAYGPGEINILPDEVRKWAGLRASTGDYGIVAIGSLVADNDSGKTFSTIADIIESSPDGLFV